MKMNRNISIALITLLMFGCNDAASKKKSGLEENFVKFDEDDSKMNSAIEKAKKSFSFFKENWETMPNDGYSLKFGLKTNDDSLEHIWFNPIKITGTKIEAECANDPVDIPGLKLGDIRTLDVQDLSDWMIISGKKCYGGYTIKVAFEEESDGESPPPFEFIEP